MQYVLLSSLIIATCVEALPSQALRGTQRDDLAAAQAQHLSQNSTDHTVSETCMQEYFEDAFENRKEIRIAIRKAQQPKTSNQLDWEQRDERKIHDRMNLLFLMLQAPETVKHIATKVDLEQKFPVCLTSKAMSRLELATYACYMKSDRKDDYILRYVWRSFGYRDEQGAGTVKFPLLLFTFADGGESDVYLNIEKSEHLKREENGEIEVHDLQINVPARIEDGKREEEEKRKKLADLKKQPWYVPGTSEYHIVYDDYYYGESDSNSGSGSNSGGNGCYCLVQ